MTVHLITVSDRASAGVYRDESGDLMQQEVQATFAGATIRRALVPDEPDRIRAALEEALAQGADVVLTTGGTGLGPRDVTPDVTAAFCTRAAPGIAEALRAQAIRETPYGMLSRGYAGLRGTMLVVNFPGRAKAVRSCLSVLLPVLDHALLMTRGGDHPGGPSSRALT